MLTLSRCISHCIPSKVLLISGWLTISDREFHHSIEVVTTISSQCKGVIFLLQLNNLWAEILATYGWPGYQQTFTWWVWYPMVILAWISYFIKICKMVTSHCYHSFCIYWLAFFCKEELSFINWNAFEAGSHPVLYQFSE